MNKKKRNGLAGHAADMRRDKGNSCRLFWTSQGTWARSNVRRAHYFAKHMSDAFQSHASENEPEVEERQEVPFQLDPPIKRLIGADVQEVLDNMNPKKQSYYDLITDKILK
jgi:hypothetical protein